MRLLTARSAVGSQQTLGIAIVFSVAALVIIVATRGQLGYRRYQREVERPAVTGTAG